MPHNGMNHKHWDFRQGLGGTCWRRYFSPGVLPIRAQFLASVDLWALNSWPVPGRVAEATEGQSFLLCADSLAHKAAGHQGTPPSASPISEHSQPGTKELMVDPPGQVSSVERELIAIGASPLAVGVLRNSLGEGALATPLCDWQRAHLQSELLGLWLVFWSQSQTQDRAEESLYDLCVCWERRVQRPPTSSLKTPPGPSPAGQLCLRGCSAGPPSCVSLSYLPLDAFCTVFELVKLH